MLDLVHLVCSRVDVFLNNASGFMSIKNQVAINDTETVEAKINFDKEYKIQGVVIK